MARNRSGIPSAARGEGTLSGRTGGPVGFSDYPSKYHGYGRRKGPKIPKVRPVIQYTGKEWESHLKKVEEKQKRGGGDKKKTKIRRSRVGAAGFNPKLGRSSPTDLIRGGRAPGGIPRKKL